jgi:hypothetical protein
MFTRFSTQLWRLSTLIRQIFGASRRQDGQSGVVSRNASVYFGRNRGLTEPPDPPAAPRAATATAARCATSVCSRRATTPPSTRATMCRGASAGTTREQHSPVPPVSLDVRRGFSGGRVRLRGTRVALAATGRQHAGPPPGAGAPHHQRPRRRGPAAGHSPQSGYNRRTL